ncbi:hypothetical protein HPB49_020417 [Dermacentor silvarum]|uniref:Uncharacterized protein n=1 Tax=Dermacentor silvarum TaxID=543639 RepID=A0ACB8DQW8_DERSI|nr:hypothetical protein HPB49_020417 [Dermacentor silvarum]
MFLLTPDRADLSNCGSPDREENSTTTGRDHRVGQEVVYDCPTGNLLVGSGSRKCATSGLWTGSAPSCKSESAAAFSRLSPSKYRRRVSSCLFLGLQLQHHVLIKFLRWLI